MSSQFHNDYDLRSRTWKAWLKLNGESIRTDLEYLGLQVYYAPNASETYINIVGLHDQQVLLLDHATFDRLMLCCQEDMGYADDEIDGMLTRTRDALFRATVGARFPQEFRRIVTAQKINRKRWPQSPALLHPKDGDLEV
jgi:hypothetical protein